MQRVKIDFSYKPEWEGIFENYSHAWCYRNGWRVEHIIGGHDDQLQECFLVFFKLCKKYSDLSRQPNFTGQHNPAKHFMGLYKTALYRQWIAITRTGQKIMVANPGEQISTEFESSHLVNEAEVLLDIAALSKEAMSVIKMIIDAPSEIIDSLWGDDSNPLIQERRLCRAAGQAHKHVFAEIRAIITGHTH
jgi:hypothetical protein